MANHTPLAIITGASSGIGEKLAHRLSARGYRTALVARRRDRLKSLAQQIHGHAYIADLAVPSAAADVARKIQADHGDVDVLINNAGYGCYRPFLETSPTEQSRLMQVNYAAAASLIHAVLPGMVKRGSGHIINIASVAAKMGPWGHSVYAAAKAAMRALTQSLAAEYASCEIHFSCVMPGLVLTEFFDDESYAKLLDRHREQAITVDVAVDRIIRLLDRPQLELTVPRKMLLLDWIAAISPSLAHKIVAKTSRPLTTTGPAAAPPDASDSPEASVEP